MGPSPSTPPLAADQAAGNAHQSSTSGDRRTGERAPATAPPRLHRVRQGLDLPLPGTAPTRWGDPVPVERVAVLAEDYAGMRPRMRVREGDRVRRGTPLFEDRKNVGVLFTSPGGGVVAGIHRGEKRALLAVVIELDAREEDETFPSYTGKPPGELSAEQVEALMLESGMWPALRTRPFSRSPLPGTAPCSIFVTAVDTYPLAPDPAAVIAGREGDFRAGLEALVALGDGCPIHLCRAPGARVSGADVRGVEVHEFAGPHPAGTVGVHISMVDPVGANRTVWHIGYQDALALGALFLTGRLSVERVVSVAGPRVADPALLRTRQGAEIAPLVARRLVEGGETRVISGSCLFGRQVEGATGHLGRFHSQVTAIAEERRRVFLGWLGPGGDKYSIMPLFLSRLTKRGRPMPLTSSTHGSRRAIVPFGVFEKVMPIHEHPTFLLRALLSRDLASCRALGVLELDPEDLALCTFACPGKNDYGPALRDVLDTIEKEG
ncbi:MAG: Na(+)-translocating NADH-quinone reductase subunit A [Candidatus Eisenbacteria bacterium]|uniref:Na(+)-translocating NADH-quinone reductase subunit A n=1 Tax=Eiseniibacteriota bacterium TaxID=2212470 RepID=A0A938BQU4_UNCEI|nr:Na(+)-translocating NADH-quinone reductase subunit A [Candidatus Eisenbacteria bacterium]